MIAPICKHEQVKKHGKNRNGTQRVRCLQCGASWTIDSPAPKAKPLGVMRGPVEDAKRALWLLTEGASIRSTARVTGLHRDTLCRLILHFGRRCQQFLDQRMRGLTLDYLQFDEQWTYVAKKQSRLTVTEREEVCYQGDVYLWTVVDQTTKLMPAFRLGKRTADNARRFALDVAGRLNMPKPHESDDHAFAAGAYRPVVQLSTDGFPGYPEAIDLAFGAYARYGVIVKEYKNAKMIYTPSEMVGHEAHATSGHDEGRQVDDMHVTRRAIERHSTSDDEATEPADVLL